MICQNRNHFYSSMATLDFQSLHTFEHFYKSLSLTAALLRLRDIYCCFSLAQSDVKNLIGILVHRSNRIHSLVCCLAFAYAFANFNAVNFTILQFHFFCFVKFRCVVVQPLKTQNFYFAKIATYVKESNKTKQVNL